MKDRKYKRKENEYNVLKKLEVRGKYGKDEYARESERGGSGKNGKSERAVVE